MKPILFNTDMVRAILEGRKTVTRRVIKPQPYAVVQQNENKSCWCGHFVSESGKVLADKPPYRRGDILYVRETWYYEEHMHDMTDGEPNLPFGRYSQRYIFKSDSPDYPVYSGVGKHGWKPSIHMPREAARIFLRVTDVRVERLRDISSEDIEQEGVDLTDLQGHGCITRNEYVYAFRTLWDSTIKPADLDRYGWAANPYVWVITFERISKKEVPQNDR